MKNRYKQAVDNKSRRPLSIQMRHRLREGIFLVSIALGIFLMIALLTYHTNDPSWSSTGMGNTVTNWCGRVGSWLADILLFLFGYVAFLFPFFLVVASWVSLKEKDEIPTRNKEWIFKAVGWVFVLLSLGALTNFYTTPSDDMPGDSGGIIGYLAGHALLMLFNQAGSTILFISILLCGITLASGLSWFGLFELIGVRLVMLWLFIRSRFARKPEMPEIEKTEPTLEKPIPVAEAVVAAPPERVIKPVVVTRVEMPAKDRKRRQLELDPNIRLEPGTLPSPTLLNMPQKTMDKAFSNMSYEELSLLVEQRLSDFGVQVKVVAVNPGPIITRFELELAPGIKVSKITGLAKDIARSLSAVSVRIVEVIPGKSVIGLEIPNEHREIVSLRDILETTRYAQARSAVSLALGKDISGNPVVVDLAKMPHLLVAGTTGAGKSVSLNAMILSLLFKASPQQLRMILIDPKMLELSVYDGIPHLLTPVITDMKDAANALRWCVAEMDKRYRLMAALGVRNVTGYNAKVNEAISKGAPMLMPGTLVTDEESAKMTLTPFPLIVVVIDEFADMMMVVGKKVEDLIARIAQKSRAAGMHLILATQRPSVDVITGLIKANIPTRVAFQVSSRIDSRTILDQQGAEQLLGHGDMLYLPPGVGVPIRVHGAYVADEEVHRVVAAWRSTGQPEYLAGITDENSGEAGADGAGTGEQDPLYDEAVRIVTESRRASISLVQRRLRIGYNRAARIMEDMEAAGVVSSVDTSGSREVLAGAPLD